jgi:hypothetical protein
MANTRQVTAKASGPSLGICLIAVMHTRLNGRHLMKILESDDCRRRFADQAYHAHHNDEQGRRPARRVIG